MVIPIAECVARPDDQYGRHLLCDHLLRVANAIGAPTDTIDNRLGFLAGLLHDAAKCHCDWQDYIHPTSTRRKGPPHAPFGAAFFSFCAESLIKCWLSNPTDRQEAQNLMLNWTMSIQCHHGSLADFTGAIIPWEKAGSTYTVSQMVSSCDMNGLFDFVRASFPDFESDVDDFPKWLGRFGRTWNRLTQNVRMRALGQTTAHELAMSYPATFSRLIVADRIDAGNIPDDLLSKTKADTAIETMKAYCENQAAEALSKGASPEMVKLRNQIQEQTLDTYRSSDGSSFYTLLLPTGYGKTLTSLRVALESCRQSVCRRIIYLAPYLSILSQAKSEIESATGIPVFQHHHLSLAALVETGNDDDFELLDTWKTPILATTFNQFFRALFPVRAQQTLRLDAIKGAFIVIDEPQIVDVGNWSLFLRALGVFAEYHDCQILFATATLPPLSTALQKNIVPLAPPTDAGHRFTIRYRPEPHTPETLIEHICEATQSHRNLAIVVNTVREAASIFRRLNNRLESDCVVHCLNAMMLPDHKVQTIKRIAKNLDRQRKGKSQKKLIVVSTQMIEAGVDLSFQRIFRARSILPSIAQVAGRANRHGEGSPAFVDVFPLLSDNGKEMRQHVYRDTTLTETTDEILQGKTEIAEPQIGRVLNQYFETCWQKNSQMACLEKFIEASLGEWSSLAGTEPFGFAAPREEVFVPIRSKRLSDANVRLVQRFAGNANELLRNYCDKKYSKSLSFLENKLFQIAIRLFIVPCPLAVAERVATRENDWLWRINRTNHYSAKTGLAHWLIDEPPNSDTSQSQIL